MRPARELQRTLDVIAETLQESVPSPTVSSVGADPDYQMIQAVYDVAEAAMFGAAPAAPHASATVVRLLRKYADPTPVPKAASSSQVHTAEAAIELLLSAAGGMVRDVEDAVLRCLEGEEPATHRRRAHAASGQVLAIVAAVWGVAAREGVTVPAKRLKGLVRQVDGILGDLPPEPREPDPFEPLSETDTVLLNYVDLDVLKARYGYGRVPAGTLRIIARGGWGFGDLVRHYLRQDLADWAATALGLDVRQAQLIAAGIASVNESCRLFSTKGEAVTVHRDAIVKNLLCEDNYGKR